MGWTRCGVTTISSSVSPFLNLLERNSAPMIGIEPKQRDLLDRGLEVLRQQPGDGEAFAVAQFQRGVGAARPQAGDDDDRRSAARRSGRSR